MPGLIVFSKRYVGAALFVPAPYDVFLALVGKFHRQADFHFILQFGDRHADILIRAAVFFKGAFYNNILFLSIMAIEQSSIYKYNI